jgi:phosphoglycolate phosphatase-like HAD superfamily hydrolase
MVSNGNLPVTDIPEEFKVFSKRYIECLEEILFQSEKPRLHNGVRDLLERLISEPDMNLAVGTGNIQVTGQMKLRRHKVDHLFPVGGYGSDSSDRATLLKIALDRARLHYQQSFPVGSYWVIGDTPNDILSGKRIAAETISVCTGSYKPSELARHRPTAILPDLTNIEYFLALVRREIDPADGQATLFDGEISGEEFDPL